MDFIKASNEVYLERKFMESYICSLQHGWMSMEGQAESYNDLWWNSHKVEIIRRFLDENPSIGRHFDKRIASKDDDEVEFDEDGEGKPKSRGESSGMQELHRKSLSQVQKQCMK